MGTKCNIGIIMNGVTGRMGTNQHLIRSILAIRQQGGLALSDGRMIYPEVVLVGRNREKLQKLGERTGITRITTDLDEALSLQDFEIYFDAQVTGKRFDSVRKAIQAGKHVYCEKPPAADLEEALTLYRLAEEKGVKHGVVQDKLWLPGMIKLKRLIEDGFFGNILSVRGEFGYWVFEGHDTPINRPSWNYRKEDDGGIITDMLCHWRYVLDNIFGSVTSVSCLGATHIPVRYDEEGQKYKVTADDSAYATFQLKNGIIAHFNSSWTVRVRRDDLLTIQVDGTKGSAVAGLRDCRIQSYDQTPVPVWNPDVVQAIDFYKDWQEFLPEKQFENAFKVQWEMFLRHVCEDALFPHGLLEGAKGIQLAYAGLESWAKRAWVDLPGLKP